MRGSQRRSWLSLWALLVALMGSVHLAFAAPPRSRQPKASAERTKPKPPKSAKSPKSAKPAKSTKEREDERYFYGAVKAGDTFASFARRFRTSVGTVRRLNGLLRARTLPVGARLKVREREFAIRSGAPADPSPPKTPAREKEWVVHKVKPGDTLGSIAERHGVRTADLVKLNRLGRRPKLKKGQVLRVKQRPDAVLVGGVALPADNRIYLRTRPDASFGTPGTIALIHEVYSAFRRLHPYSVPGVIADISRVGGGYFPPHKSHRRGVDADVGYFKVGNEPLRYLEVVTPETIDIVKTWDLIRLFINTGHVSVIFMDLKLQGVLYDHLKARGYDSELLEVLLQYPRSIGEKGGLLRHSPGHHHHLHVRFDCVDPVAQCKPSAVAIIPDEPGTRVAIVAEPGPAEPRPAPRSALDILRARATLHVVEGDEDELEDGALDEGGSDYVDHATIVEDAEGTRLHGAALEGVRTSVWGRPGGGPLEERSEEEPTRCTRFGCEAEPR